VISKRSNEFQTRSWLQDLLVLSLFLGVFYALWIGSYALFTPDEGRYSEVAREMLSSHDFLTPRLNGVAFLDKPVLYYWLQASAIKMFGLKEWSLRFWPALLGVFCTLLTYVTGRLLYTRRTGVIAACMLAFSPLYYGGSHYANLDLEVASLIADSLLCFIAAMQIATAGRLKTFLLLSAYVFAGLAALTKGLIGIVFPALIIGAWTLILMRWNILLKMRLVTGLIIFFLIAAPWYFLVQHANPEFLHYFFVTQQVSRFLTTQEFNSKAAVWFYIPIVLAGFFPWTVFLLQALGRNLKLIWQDRQAHATELFLMLWLVIIMAFFSVPRSKTVGYILPVFPACALIVAHYLNMFWERPRSPAIIAGVAAYTLLTGLLTAFIFAAPLWISTLETPVGFLPYLYAMALVLFAAGAVCAWTLLRGKTLLPLFISLSLTTMTVLLIFINSTNTINEKSIKPLALELKTLLNPEDEVVVFYKYYHDLAIYSERRVTIVADWHAPDISQSDNWLREMWYGMVFQNTKDWLIAEDAFWDRWHSSKRLYVVTNVDQYNVIRAKAPVYIISTHKEDLLISNHPVEEALAKHPELAQAEGYHRQNS
jgi:hypothetical protein